MKYIRAHSIISLLCLSFSLEINGIKKIIKRKRRARLVSVSFLSLCSSFLGQRDVSFGAAAARYVGGGNDDVVVVVVVVSTSLVVLAAAQLSFVHNRMIQTIYQKNKEKSQL